MTKKTVLRLSMTMGHQDPEMKPMSIIRDDMAPMMITPALIGRNQQKD